VIRTGLPHRGGCVQPDCGWKLDRDGGSAVAPFGYNSRHAEAARVRSHGCSRVVCRECRGTEIGARPVSAVAVVAARAVAHPGG